jgi:hypothetical protein
MRSVYPSGNRTTVSCGEKSGRMSGANHCFFSSASASVQIAQDYQE